MCIKTPASFRAKFSPKTGKKRTIMRNINLFQSFLLLIINKRKGIEYHFKPS